MRIAIVLLVAMFSIAGADAPKQARQSSALVLVIDRSGSMQGPKLEAVKTAAAAAASALHPDDQIAIVAFDSEAQTFVKLQPSRNRAQIAKDLARLTSGGGTNVFPGLEEASDILTAVKAKTKHVILLSDGEAPTAGISELVKAMRKANVTISTVAVDGADETLLRLISTEGGGRFYKVADLKQLSQTYVKETKVAIK